MLFNTCSSQVLDASRKRASIGRWALASLLSIILVMGLTAWPCTAQAEVRKTDVVLGSTVEDRGSAARLFPSVEAEYALLVTGSGEPYYERNAIEQVQIASITKIMTAIISLEVGDLNQEITVSAESAGVGESSAELKEGDVLTLQEALQALLIPSGNDAAIAIAQALGPTLDINKYLSNTQAVQHFSELGVDINQLAQSDNSQDVFVAAMNVRAYEIGMEHTVFHNAHGLDNDSYDGLMYSTAEDVSIMCRFAMQNEDFRSIVASENATIAVKQKDGQEKNIELESTDELIGNYDGACGVKTGNTQKAGPCFAGACQRDGEYIYAIILNSTSEEQRFVDAKNLYNWYWDNHVTYQLAQSDETVSATINGQTTEVPVVAEVSMADWPDKTVKATFANPDETVEVFAMEGNISQSFDLHEVKGAVTAGEVLGTATFYQHNQEIAQVDVIAAEDAAAPDILQTVGIWWDRLWKGFSGERTVAESVIINETPLIYDKVS